MTKRLLTIIILASFAITAFAQLGPTVTSWLQNTTQTGTYYTATTAATATAVSNSILVNCQKVQYSTNYVYVTTTGVPSYPTGPFQDGNPSNATNQSAIFKIPRSPQVNTGTKTATTAGNIGVFINGVALYDYRDGVAWNSSTGGICGGPGNTPCTGGPSATQAWNRDAILAERNGFDCAKGHPAMGNYHHHQNPSAFKLDLTTLSTVCDKYDSDGLYVINSAQHSPLLGFAYDGFPIYGAYAYKNLDGTGGITRMKSSYQLKTTRGTGSVPSTTTYPMGYFREDYEYVAHSGENDYLDAYNGRICKTPEYPDGIYCYFATVDANHNSAYPYVVGPSFYGVVSVSKVTSITESVTTYSPTVPVDFIDFHGKIDKKNALLEWTVATEINNSHYIVEHSTDGLLFEEIGKVKSKGNTAQKWVYNFTDENIPEGKLYYKIKQVDFDGKYTFTPVISLQNTYNGFGYKVFPNPVSDLLVIQTDDIVLSDVHVSLINALGVKVLEKVFLAGSSNCFLDTQTLYNGIYHLVLTERGGVSKTQKVVVQKN